MSFELDEAEILEHLDWIDELSDVSSQEYSKPRYEKPMEAVDNLKVVSWWDFYSNETTLEEWDYDIQFYDEDKDSFREWTNRHNIDFTTVSLLRSLQLDDIKSLKNIDNYQYSVIQNAGNIDHAKLDKALKSLSKDCYFEEDTFPDDEVVVVNETEFNLRPRLTRNLPLRRSTRAPHRSGKRNKEIQVRNDGTRTMPRQRIDHNNRRLSWETFTFFDRKSQSTGGLETPNNISLLPSSPTEKTSSSSPTSRSGSHAKKKRGQQHGK